MPAGAVPAELHHRRRREHILSPHRKTGLLKEILAGTLKYEQRDMLQLFLAKTMDNQWLSSLSEDVKELKEGKTTALIADLTKEDQALHADESLAEALVEMDPPLTRQIHVLVVVPAQVDDTSPAMILLELMLPRMLVGASTTVTERNSRFKENLCTRYGSYRRDANWLRCMLLDVAFPKSLVIASHLFPRRNERAAFQLVKISDIDDVRNGLLLFKPLEYAFDRFKISFICETADIFRLKLWDESMRHTRLIDLVTIMEGPSTKKKESKVLDEKQMTELNKSLYSLTEEQCHFNEETTFGDVDGSILTFPGEDRPFCRCLKFQAIIAFEKATTTDDFPDFWRDEEDLDDLVVKGLTFPMVLPYRRMQKKKKGRMPKKKNVWMPKKKAE